MINEQILEKLFAENIRSDEALLYLLGLYYNISTQIIPKETIQAVNLLRIVERDYTTGKVKWNIPLFTNEIKENIDENWNWVIDDYRTLFLNIKKDKGGDRKSCISKMQKFFSQNPHVRIEDVLKAAIAYTNSFLNGSQNPTYMVQADYFISKKIDGSIKSRLEQYLEITKDIEQDSFKLTNRYSNKIK